MFSSVKAFKCSDYTGSSKVSVHLMITIQKQVHIDFLITLCIVLMAVQ